jgi:sec-independent protein translocase protein TatA
MDRITTLEVAVFSLGVPELLVIFIIVLFIFGGKRLPEIGRALGKSIREFKSATDKDKDEISTWISSEEGEEESSPATANNENEKDVFQDKMEDIPGVKEAQEIKKTASKIKAAGRFFMKK